jgi:ABC-type multidrug transport system fused ATPase/permease subunit
MHHIKEERSLGDLFADLSRETRILLRQEMELAKTELSQKASKAGKASASLAIGGAVAYAGFLAIVAAIIIGLAALIPAWLSALIVGLVVVGIGYFFIQKGLNDLKPEELVPRQTIESLKETQAWAQDQI